MLKALTKQEIIQQLKGSDRWSINTRELKRTWEFSDFHEAMSFIMRVAFLAEQHNHHPVINNVYSKVELRITTHEADNQVTERDIILANSISDIRHRAE